jgi:hypothetical protein
LRARRFGIGLAAHQHGDLFVVSANPLLRGPATSDFACWPWVLAMLLWPADHWWQLTVACCWIILRQANGLLKSLCRTGNVQCNCGRCQPESLIVPRLVVMVVAIKLPGFVASFFASGAAIQAAIAECHHATPESVVGSGWLENYVLDNLLQALFAVGGCGGTRLRWTMLPGWPDSDVVRSLQFSSMPRQESTAVLDRLVMVVAGCWGGILFGRQSTRTRATPAQHIECSQSRQHTEYTLLVLVKGVAYSSLAVATVVLGGAQATAYRLAWTGAAGLVLVGLGTNGSWKSQLKKKHFDD